MVFDSCTELRNMGQPADCEARYNSQEAAIRQVALPPQSVPLHTSETNHPLSLWSGG